MLDILRLQTKMTNLPSLKKRVLIDLSQDSADENEAPSLNRLPRLVVKLSPESVTDGEQFPLTRPAIMDSPQVSDQEVDFIPSSPSILIKRVDIGCRLPQPIYNEIGYALCSSKSYFLSRLTAKSHKRVIDTGLFIVCPRGFYVECHRGFSEGLKVRRKILHRGHLRIRVRLTSKTARKYILSGDIVARLTVGRWETANFVEVPKIAPRTENCL